MQKIIQLFQNLRHCLLDAQVNLLRHDHIIFFNLVLDLLLDTGTIRTTGNVELEGRAMVVGETGRLEPLHLLNMLLPHF